jgi:predicted transcriptional regulator
MSANLDPPTDLMCLEYLCSHPTGARVKDLTSYVRLTHSPILKRMRRLTEVGFVKYEEIPHRNPGMPATFVYYPTSGWDLEAVRKTLASTQLGRSALVRVTESKSITDIDKGDTDFSRKISCIRPSSRQEHIQLAKLAVEIGSLTMILGSELTGRPRQTIHSQLKRLADIGVLCREKQELENGSKEFVYFLASDLKSSDVLSYPCTLTNSRVSDMNPDPCKAVAAHSVSQLTIPLMQDEATQVSPADLSKLMSLFDHTWPEDWKAIWFSALKKIVGDSK